MGFSLSWLAVKGKSPAEVHQELQLRTTGRPGEIADSPIVGSKSADGWYLIVACGCDHRIISDAVIGNLSLGCEVLTCTIEEHVMFSRACGWKHGHLLWSVSHKGEDGPKDIAAEGVLPPGYIPIRDRFISEQEAEGGSEADVDCLFEIPIALVQSLTGFRPDEASPAFEEGGFELLESSRKPWFQRIFSK